MTRRHTRPLARCRRNRLATAMLGALLAPMAGAALAQDDTSPEAELDRITVTGSLIPQSVVETSTPITVITADDISARGYVSVADVLQRSSMATGGVQGAQTSASFTQGAETMSLFGLPPGYTKYLIDGRPMASYPALYNGSDTFNNISGIPVELVERIEILPGGQSSIYGSDAIAGVVNFILKKRMDGSVATVRKGWYDDAGGDSIRGSFTTGFSGADDRFNVLLGIQYEDKDPIWGYERDITSSYFTEGTSAPIASRDVLVFSPFNSYIFKDPNNCANLTGLFDGGLGLQTRPGFGEENYCGSFNSPGYRTLSNGKESTEVYSHITFDLSESTTLYADILLSDSKVDYFTGSNYLWWGTQASFGYFYDPNTPDDLLNLQRAFAPEEIGANGFSDAMSRDDSESYMITVGLDGIFGDSDWEYDVNISRTQYKLDETTYARLADKIDQFFIDRVLGPELGRDPLYGNYPIFSPNWAAFYSPITPEEFRSFMGHVTNKSETSDNLVRAQLTNTALFSMAGGDAGLALVAEYGEESWEQNPDPLYLNGGIWGQTTTSGAGERDRYAVTSELRLPVLDQLTVNVAARYDAFKAYGREIDKPTYSVGVEFRPLDTLLFRGKYGTAFRSPTLSDLTQGESGFYTTVIDYYQCSVAGYAPEDASAECPAALSSRQIFGVQSGNLELDPIEADVWSAGVVWAPLDNMSIALDYHNWDIADEVNQYTPDRILLQEYRCRTGLDDINSALCQDAIAAITRNATGGIDEVLSRKINVSRQQLEVYTAAINYGFGIGNAGDLMLRASYTQKIRHDYQQFDGDDMLDLLNDPIWSTDPKRKGDFSISWRKDRWGATAYANWFDKTPNFRASQVGYGPANTGKLGSFATYNASVSFNATDALGFSFLVNNLTDKMPPVDRSYPGTSGSPYNSSNFNPYGRSFFLEARYAFGQ